MILPDSIKAPEFDLQKTYDTLNINLKVIAVSQALDNLKEASRSINQKSGALHNEIKNIKRFEVDWHKKLTLSFACLVFFFIGAPLGAIIRKGGLGTPSVISVLFFVIYYVISMSGEKLVKEDQISSIGGMWLASFILLPIGIMLTYMATTDSVVMNTDTYTLFFKKIGTKLSAWTGIKPK
jgi:lipopolysaccharide export system permease protein